MRKKLTKFLNIFNKDSQSSSSEKIQKKGGGKKNVQRKKKTISEDQILKDIQASITKNGSKSISVGGLYRAFGYKRRGPKNTEEINDFLKRNKLCSYPVLNADLAWSSRVELYKFPKKGSSDFHENEKELQKALFTKGLLHELKLQEIIPEHSPDRTRDRMDFFARDNGRNVVVEVKLKGGGKIAVEQVLRYAGMLKQQHPDTHVRKILITGVQDQHTAKAIHGMTNEERDLFEWHLYSYIKSTGAIMLNKVNYEELFPTFIQKDK